MKTLRQIREECNYIPKTAILNEAQVGKKHSATKAGFPNMPSMLLFKRVTYRIYPNNQMVALYYSRMIDKYLTIPFSKEGVMQVNEGVIHDSINEEWNEQKTTTEKVDCKEAFRQKLSHIREEKLDEFAALAAAGEALAGAAARGAAAAGLGSITRRGIGRTVERAVTKVGGKGGLKAYRSLKKGAADMASDAAKPSDSKEQPKSQAVEPSRTGDVKLPSIKSGSSWTAKEKQVQENKISDVRSMLNSGSLIHEMNINGKTITLNNTMAKRILEVYDSVNTKNKKIVEGMLNEDLESFKKLLNFSIRK